MSDQHVEEIVDGEVVYAVVPWNGEALAIRDMPDQQLAELLQAAREFEQEQMRAFKRDIQVEFLARLDRQASWTLHLADGVTVSGDAPGRVEYDVLALQTALQQLVDDDAITEEAAARAVREKVTYEPAAAGIKALKKIGGTVTAAIEACEHPSAKPRAVRITNGPR